MWSAIGAWQGLQGPDLEPPAPVRAMLDDTRIVRDGLGDLLLRYDMQHDGIAVFYSYPSVFLGDRGERNKDYRTHNAAYLAWQNVIHDLNMQYNFVTERMLASGEFDAGGYKVLILPQAWAMGPQAVAAIRKFVEAGGTVIADIRPALYDERCRQVERGAMDDLFGVQGGLAPATPSNLRIEGQLAEADVALVRPGPAYDRQAIIDPTVKLTTGQALGKAGDVPTCIVDQTGRGRTVLLNFVLDSSFRVRGDTEGLAGTAPSDVMPDDVAYFFLNLFSVAGVERAFTFTQYKREKVPFFPNVRVQRWRNGDYQIVGFFRQTDTEVRLGSVIPDSEKWPVSPQRKASNRPYAPFPYVYDIKNGLTVGLANWFITEINPARPSLYVWMPGQLPQMALDLPKEVRRGEPVTVRISVPQARGLHAIKFRAAMPNGQPAKFWDQSVIVGKEPKTVVLPLAWNDPAGGWVITLTDLFSAETAKTMTLKVE